MVHPQHDDSWYKSTWTQRAWFASGCTTVLISLAKSLIITISGAGTSTTTPLTWLRLTFAALLGYVLADLGSGIYHWAMENYGSPETPVVGFIVKSFLDHHRHPLEHNKCDIASLLYRVATVATAVVMPVNMFSNDPVLLWFVGVLWGFGIFNVKIHVWAHTPRRNLPPLVAALQDAGIILRWSQHGAHHLPPYNSNYCAVSGICDRVLLDKYKVFTAVEVVLFRVTSVRPRSWAEPDSDWTQKPTS
ncbi:hypothetical protein BUALT_Bualt18G0066900 [Buddleja alternifolia]|uniref:Lipid desaturase domain-containing protein n=1 Tax=Buddleja alternifolia TaxID=168488 RepID=A0AAV6W4Y3_9LAMI|nr:hypothetical protein BUALT_Bualt18G0066900 [Buddleja alternifolia]